MQSRTTDRHTRLISGANQPGSANGRIPYFWSDGIPPVESRSQPFARHLIPHRNLPPAQNHQFWELPRRSHLTKEIGIHQGDTILTVVFSEAFENVSRAKCNALRSRVIKNPHARKRRRRPPQRGQQNDRNRTPPDPERRSEGADWALKISLDASVIFQSDSFHFWQETTRHTELVVPFHGFASLPLQSSIKSNSGFSIR